MAIFLTLFKNQFDNKTHRRMDFSSFNELEKLLYALSRQPKKGKKDAELISPAIYKPNTTRANKNVLSWAGWAAVDVDDIKIKGDVNDYLFDRFGQWRYVCYSTASSRKDHPKFRIVFELNEHIPSEQIKHFWWSLNSELDSIGDKQTKDLSRMYYIPAQYDQAFNFFYSNPGKPINCDELLLKWPYAEKKHSNNFMDRLPEKLQRQVIDHRKSKMEATGYLWSGYSDCPFWPRRLADEYRSITETGWYHKMYQIMVATASRAISKEYPITASQIADLCKEFDRENGNWYENRPLEVEADRALEYAYRNT